MSSYRHLQSQVLMLHQYFQDQYRLPVGSAGAAGALNSLIMTSQIPGHYRLCDYPGQRHRRVSRVTERCFDSQAFIFSQVFHNCWLCDVINVFVPMQLNTDKPTSKRFNHCKAVSAITIRPLTSVVLLSLLDINATRRMLDKDQAAVGCAL